jgi:hypothetical protein
MAMSDEPLLSVPVRLCKVRTRQPEQTNSGGLVAIEIADAAGTVVDVIVVPRKLERLDVNKAER